MILATTKRHLPARTRLLRRACALLALSCLMLTAGSPSADEAQVPEGLQAELFARLLPYDRNFRNRAGSLVQILILVKPNNVRSKTSALRLERRLSAFDRIGGLPHRVEIVQYESASALAKACAARQTSVVYVTPGFDHEAAEIRAALSALNVLSVAVVPAYVPSGIVVGFELSSSKPRMLINLVQAKRQKVDFPSAVLKLMKVVER
jgi:hypothetical protein